MERESGAAAALGRRERRRLATRRAIQAAALRLAVERGLEGATVQAISDAADIAPRTFFTYFASKEEALRPDQPWTAARLRAAVLARPAAEPPLRVLRAVMQAMAAEVTASGELLPLWRALARQQPGLVERFLGTQEERVQALAEGLAARLGADARRAAYPLVAAWVAWAAGQAAVQRWLQAAAPAGGAPPAVAPFIDEAFDLLEGGL